MQPVFESGAVYLKASIENWSVLYQTVGYTRTRRKGQRHNPYAPENVVL